MHFSIPPTSWPTDDTTIVRFLTHSLADWLIDLSHIAHHAPLGITTPGLAPGWYFSTALDPAMAFVDNHTPTMFRMRNFITIFEKTSTGRHARFALSVTYGYQTHQVEATWNVLNFSAGLGHDTTVSWDAVWQTVLFDDD